MVVREQDDPRYRGLVCVAWRRGKGVEEISLGLALVPIQGGAPNFGAAGNNLRVAFVFLNKMILGKHMTP